MTGTPDSEQNESRDACEGHRGDARGKQRAAGTYPFDERTAHRSADGRHGRRDRAPRGQVVRFGSVLEQGEAEGDEWSIDEAAEREEQQGGRCRIEEAERDEHSAPAGGDGDDERPLPGDAQGPAEDGADPEDRPKRAEQTR